MYPVLVGHYIHQEGIAEVYGGVFWEKEEMVHCYVEATGNHYLILVVTVGFNNYCGYGFVGYHNLYFTLSSAGSQAFF